MESIFIKDWSMGPVCRTVISDVTDRKQAEEERAQLLTQEQAARAEAERICWRLTFLAEASEILSDSLDYETTLARVARLTIPYLADACVIDLLEKDRPPPPPPAESTDPSPKGRFGGWRWRRPI